MVHKFSEQIAKKKKFNIFLLKTNQLILKKCSGPGIGSFFQGGSRIQDPHPHQNVMDPQHCYQYSNLILTTSTNINTCIKAELWMAALQNKIISCKLLICYIRQKDCLTMSLRLLKLLSWSREMILELYSRRSLWWR